MSIAGRPGRTVAAGTTPGVATPRPGTEVPHGVVPAIPRRLTFTLCSAASPSGVVHARVSWARRAALLPGAEPKTNTSACHPATSPFCGIRAALGSAVSHERLTLDTVRPVPLASTRCESPVAADLRVIIDAPVAIRERAVIISCRDATMSAREHPLCHVVLHHGLTGVRRHQREAGLSVMHVFVVSGRRGRPWKQRVTVYGRPYVQGSPSRTLRVWGWQGRAPMMPQVTVSGSVFVGIMVLDHWCRSSITREICDALNASDLDLELQRAGTCRRPHSWSALPRAGTSPLYAALVEPPSQRVELTGRPAAHGKQYGC